MTLHKFKSVCATSEKQYTARGQDVQAAWGDRK